ncbi:MAG: PorT family protein [Spirochaetes bacterium]|nr:PorT family protein [Spirochaetota bacterium]
MRRFVIFVILFIIIFSFSLQANSSPALVVKGGVNSSEFKYEDDIFGVENSSIMGFTGGIGLDVPFLKYFGVEMDIFFSQKGGERKAFIPYAFDFSTFDFIYANINSIDTLSYLEFPLILKGRLGGRQIKFFAGVGASFGLFLGGNAEREVTLNGETTFEEGRLIDINPIDISFVLSAGVELLTFVLEFRLEQGMENINNDELTRDIEIIKNNTLSFLVGFKFGKPDDALDPFDDPYY